MCGIVGWIDTQRNLTGYRKLISDMTDTLSRRGPDAQGFYHHQNALLGHRRLVVVDPAGGRQPMTVETALGRYVLIYNGELYNTEELRAELLKLGHSFRGYSDTEVLLWSYVQWGSRCVDRFNGIFAFAVWDEVKQILFAARDPLGVKPFFYARRGSSLFFASELKALLVHPQVEPIVQEQGLLELFALGPARSPDGGIFKDIHELAPATSLTFDGNELQFEEYWHLETEPHTETLDETVEHVRQLLVDAIERQLIADVPVCSFLSGGLDSTIISAIAARYFREQGSQLQTWSIDYQDNSRYFQANAYQPDSDSIWASRAAKLMNTKHHNVLLDSDHLANALTDAVLASDLPGMADIDSSLWLFCRSVRQNATVALSGECADEIFGGYPWYWRPDLVAADTFPWSLSVQERKRIIAPDLTTLPLAEYAREKYQQTIARVEPMTGESARETRARELFYLNLRWFMLTLLNRKDRMSMANSLEVRVPFADYRLVQYAYNIPWAYKYCDAREKGLLRRAAQGIIPEPVLNRKKSPYPKTHHPAYTNLVQNWLGKIVSNPASPVLQLINIKEVEALISGESGAMNQPWYGQLMTGPQLMAWLIQLNTWLREYKIILR